MKNILYKTFGFNSNAVLRSFCSHSFSSVKESIWENALNKWQKYVPYKLEIVNFINILEWISFSSQFTPFWFPIFRYHRHVTWPLYLKFETNVTTHKNPKNKTIKTVILYVHLYVLECIAYRISHNKYQINIEINRWLLVVGCVS